MPLIVGSLPTAVEEFPLDLPTRAYLAGGSVVLSGSGGDEYADEDGCLWELRSEPWGPKPAPREQAGDRSNADGQYDGTRFHGPRVIPLTGAVQVPSHGLMHRARQRLSDAVPVTPFPYRVTEPGFDSWAMARQQGPVDWTETSPTLATFTLTLYAGDPLIYSALERTFSLGFPTVAGGLAWPATWPTEWVSTGVVSEALLSNPGVLPVGLRLTVAGPVDAVSVALPELGRSMLLARPGGGGPVLAAGEFFEVDTGRSTALVNGASRRSWVSGSSPWLRLPPGVVTRLVVSATGAGDGAGVSGSYRAVRI